MRLEDVFKRGWLYQATGYTVLASFLFTIISLIFISIPEANREIFIHALGIIEGAFVGNLVNHFFGSSQPKQEKKQEDAL